MSHKGIISGIQKVCDKKRPLYNPGRVYSTPKRPRKPPKDFSLDLTAFKYSGSEKEEYEERDLTNLGTGTITLNEFSNEEDVNKEIRSMVAQFPNGKTLEGNEYIFLKRNGRKKQFTRHLHSHSFKYDAKGLKEMKTRDAKTVYVLFEFKTSRLGISSLPETPSFSGTKGKAFRDFVNRQNVAEDSDEFSDTGSDIRSPLTAPLRNSTAAIDVESYIGRKRTRDFGGNQSVIVHPESDDYNNLMVAFMILTEHKDFSNSINLVLIERANKLKDIELALSQLLLAVKYPDKGLWAFAIKDLFEELNLSNESVEDILKLICNSLKSLNCKIWDENFFSVLFGSSLKIDYYEDDDQTSKTQIVKDTIFLSVKIPERCRGFEDIFQRFTNMNKVPVPTEFKENFAKETIWKRCFFEMTPTSLIIPMKWAFSKNMEFDTLEFPANLIEDACSRNTDNYQVSMLVVSSRSKTYLAFSHPDRSNWNVFENGCVSVVDREQMFQTFCNMENSHIEMIVCKKDSHVEIECSESLLTNAKFLIERLQERKISSDPLKDPLRVKADKGSLNSIMEKIEYRIRKIHGQKELKSKISTIARRAVFDKKRGAIGDNSKLHMLFCGNPGTGKTMAARTIAGILYDIGLVNSDTVVEVQRSDLVADHIGGTAKKTNAAIKKANGGVLFIDEAYTLSVASSEKDFGKEAIETLMAVMNGHPQKTIEYPILIFAGYTKEMNQFMEVNPGLARRIKTVLNFKDYTCDELAKITESKLIEKKMRFPLGITSKLSNAFNELPLTDRSKHNGALSSDLIDFIQDSQEERLDPEMATKSDLFQLRIEDIENGIMKFIARYSKEKSGNQVSVATQTPEVVMNVPNVGLIFCSP